MSDLETDGFGPLVAVTDRARELVLSLRDEESDPDGLALWLEVKGVADGAYTYDLYFESTADAAPDDVVQHSDDLMIVVPATSAPRVRGATLDLSEDGGMVLVNPNTPPPVPGWEGRPAPDLSSDLAQRVIEVLETMVNPSIAAHGGHADLVAVDDDDGVAYLRLGGGCVGCGMASVTLGQGIEVAIKDTVPEIRSVVDVTDHASGTNPYFEPAKK